ncbi:hypothetical protein L198_08219 [Cryptococcus wingfieldii CBS 7118]|uniref:Uncharacterized protein n=1 Tax=Cryptococcus wingfieldii CBS 7118 TaxID=1295528 RepID=A0A1E3HD61_9TREE|nr:hypothetical protein L198_08219 [Cryptococcus wingfieldii CBS 7118]ODN74289.1 hypothetical protein L198_08219 [Cryptococcus wingfieldii CBS 7118]
MAPKKPRPPALPAFSITTLAPLFPVHYLIFRELLHLAPTKYMLLSKAHNSHAKDQCLASLLPLYYARSIRFDDLRTWVGFSLDFGWVYIQHRRRRIPGDYFASQRHPIKLFRHVRQIEISLLPFATIASITEELAREKKYPRKDLGNTLAMDQEIGSDFEELVIHVDRPFTKNENLRLYSFGQLVSNEVFTRQKRTTICVHLPAKDGPSLADLRSRLPLILNRNMNYPCHRVVIHPTNPAEPFLFDEATEIVAKYLAGRARLRAAGAGTEPRFPRPGVEIHVPQADALKDAAFGWLEKELPGDKHDVDQKEMEKVFNFVKLDPAMTAGGGHCI